MLVMAVWSLALGLPLHPWFSIRCVKPSTFLQKPFMCKTDPGLCAALRVRLLKRIEEIAIEPRWKQRGTKSWGKNN